MVITICNDDLEGDERTQIETLTRSRKKKRSQSRENSKAEKDSVENLTKTSISNDDRRYTQAKSKAGRRTDRSSSFKSARSLSGPNRSSKSEQSAGYRQHEDTQPDTNRLREQLMMECMGAIERR